MTVSFKQLNVFSPPDIHPLRSSLEAATKRLQHQYGFNGSALDTARGIAAKAICNAAQESKNDIRYLEDEGVEAVRLSLISGSYVRSLQPMSAKWYSIKKAIQKLLSKRGK